MMQEFISKSPDETREFAAMFAGQIKPKSNATVIALEGELGAGKTLFTQALGVSLGVIETITSPTFVLMKCYKLKSRNHKQLVHIDAYRLRDETELNSMGFTDFQSDPENIIVIEWSDRIQKALPNGYIKIHIDHIESEVRRISVEILGNSIHYSLPTTD